MRTHTEKISIIVPVYKVEKELERCVGSIIRQTYSNIEIILVDDGSPDGCPEMCDRYAGKDSRIQVIHKENGGLSDARNTGLRLSDGKYVLYVDGDDYIEADACEKLLSAMTDEVDFVVGAYREINGECSSCYGHSNMKEKKVYTAQNFVIASIKKNEWYAMAVLNLYRRDFLIENHLFFKEGYYFEDMQMLPRLYLAARQVVYVDYPFYNYVIRENSIMTSQNSVQKIQMSVEIYREWMILIEPVEKEYQRYLYGILVRYYLRSCRIRKIRKWEVPGMDCRFAFRYALGVREKVKVLFFSLLPALYVRGS